MKKNNKKNSNGYIKTDLALECRARQGKDKANIDGIDFFETQRGGVTVSRLNVTKDDASSLLGKPKGSYITVGFNKPWLMTDEEKSELVNEISSALKALISQNTDKAPEKISIVGLGNKSLTSDALGPDVISRLTATRRLKLSDPRLFAALGRLETTCISPGVSGQTGFESAEAVKKLTDIAKPDVIIAIDSLAARSPERLCSTVQLCDTGIAPGEGVGNRRMKLDKSSMDVPVIALGVPTVVSSGTLVYDCLERSGAITDGDTENNRLLKKILTQNGEYFVSLKETDAAVTSLSGIIAEAIESITAAEQWTAARQSSAVPK